MTFFSRPLFDDIQFKQPVDSSISLSGLTKIKTTSGLTLSDGSGGDVTITASGASPSIDGHVLTYVNGLISLQPSSVSGGTTILDTHRETTRSGVPTVCVGGECTISNFIEGYFFPAVAPTSSLSIATGGAIREFGNDTVGNLCYQAIRQTNPICLIAINDDGISGYDEFLVSTCICDDCCGIISYSLPSSSCVTPMTGTTQTSANYGVCVGTICGESSVSSASITWRNKRFSFKSSVLYTDSSITGILSGGEFSTTRSKTILNEEFNNEFYYYVYPTSFGEPNFAVNGLPNNSWGSSDNNTLYKFNYINAHGYINQYYVARSDNKITGTYNIEIS